jgi:hypothetical protein
VRAGPAAIQILSGSDRDDGWDSTHAIQEEIRDSVGGIFQADHEGFSNEDGDHILWEFDDSVTGPWNMAVLGPDGDWIPFEMELGDRRQREAFWAGEVPDGAKRA